MKVSAPQPLRELHARPGPGLDAMRQLDRTARLPQLLDVSCDFGEIIRGLDLVVIGVGSVGMHLVDHCARLGVRSLLLVDPGRFKPESTLTHPVQPGDLGRTKVTAAGAHAKAISPDTRIFVIERAFESLPMSTWAGASAFLLASDNLLAESRVSQAALQLGIPLLQAAVEGRTLTAQVRSLSNADDQSPDLPCGYSQDEWEQLDRGTRYSCAGASAAGASWAGTESTAPAAEPTQVPTASVPHLCAIAANLALMELTRRAVGVGDLLESRVIEYCGFTQRITHTRLERKADCPLDHTRMKLERSGSDLGQRSIRELQRAAGCDGDPLRSVSFHVEGQRFAVLASCKCPTHPRLDRFVANGQDAGPCPKCGERRRPHVLHSHDEVPLSALDEHRARSLASLGAGSPGGVRVRGERGTTLFYRPALPQARAGAA
jgi:molybdopterin/thiamine biosynthesis adenylyltransferase